MTNPLLTNFLEGVAGEDKKVDVPKAPDRLKRQREEVHPSNYTPRRADGTFTYRDLGRRALSEVSHAWFGSDTTPYIPGVRNIGYANANEPNVSGQPLASGNQSRQRSNDSSSASFNTIASSNISGDDVVAAIAKLDKNLVSGLNEIGQVLTSIDSGQTTMTSSLSRMSTSLNSIDQGVMKSHRTLQIIADQLAAQRYKAPENDPSKLAGNDNSRYNGQQSAGGGNNSMLADAAKAGVGAWALRKLGILKNSAPAFTAAAGGALGAARSGGSALLRGMARRLPLVGGAAEAGLSLYQGEGVGTSIARGAGTYGGAIAGGLVGGIPGAIAGGVAGPEITGWLYNKAKRWMSGSQQPAVASTQQSLKQQQENLEKSKTLNELSYQARELSFSATNMTFKASNLTFDGIVQSGSGGAQGSAQPGGSSSTGVGGGGGQPSASGGQPGASPTEGGGASESSMMQYPQAQSSVIPGYPAFGSSPGGFGFGQFGQPNKLDDPNSMASVMNRLRNPPGHGLSGIGSGNHFGFGVAGSPIDVRLRKPPTSDLQRLQHMGINGIGAGGFLPKPTPMSALGVSPNSKLSFLPGGLAYPNGLPSSTSAIPGFSMPNGAMPFTPGSRGNIPGLSDPASKSPSIAERLKFYREYAQSQGVDPDVVTGIVMGEGGATKGRMQNWSNVDMSRSGKHGVSYGDFQLRRSAQGGMGDDFARAHPDIPLDSAHWREQGKFAIDRMARKGFGAWMSVEDRGGLGNIRQQGQQHWSRYSQGLGKMPNDPNGAPSSMGRFQQTQAVADRIRKIAPHLSNQQCVELAKKYVGSNDSVTSWRRGENALSGNLRPGTPIATFMDRKGNPSDRYDAGGIGAPGNHTTHAAVFNNYTRDKDGNITGMNVFEQYKGSGGIKNKTYGLDGFGTKNASNYFSINDPSGNPLGKDNPMLAKDHTSAQMSQSGVLHSESEQNAMQQAQPMNINMNNNNTAGGTNGNGPPDPKVDTPTESQVYTGQFGAYYT